jgi:nucleoside-diphosphate-sugar epimerase
MKILLIGGTGFIGTRVVQSLAGHDVTVLSRGTTSHQVPGVAYWPRIDRLRLHEHRAGIARLRPDVVLDMIPQNGLDARSVADAVAGLTGRLVAVSSGSVYRSFGRLLGSESGPVDNTPSAEDAPLREKRFPYRGSEPRAVDDPRRWLDDYDKIPAEEAVLSHLVLPANVVRLPMVYGPGDPDRRVAGYVARMLVGCREILLRESAAGWRSSRAYVENVGHAIARVVVLGRPGRVYNVAEANHFTEAEWIRRIGVQADWDGLVRGVPEDGLSGPPFVAELPPDANYAQHLILDDSLIRRELGYEEVVPFEEGLRRTVVDARRLSSTTPGRAAPGS